MHEAKYRHPLHRKPEHMKIYDIWRKMLQRCTDPQSNRYADYGGRGIKICDEWANDFDAFADWSLENGYEIGLTIDRIDNDGNYEPSNCRWLTKREQNRNKRTNVMVTYKGETKPLIVWCEELGLKYDPIHHRITHGWPVEVAFTRPLTSEYESFASICRRHGINPGTARDRIMKLGWSFDDAINTPTRSLNRNQADCGEAVCIVCGKTFTKRTARQMCCSKECSQESKRAEFKKTRLIAV